MMYRLLTNHSDQAALQRLIAFIHPHQNKFYLLLTSIVLTSILIPLQPYCIQIIIDKHLVTKDYAGLLVMIGGLLLIAGTQGIAQYYQTYLADWISQHIIEAIRIQLYTHTLYLRDYFFKKTPVGQLVTIHISDTTTLANVLNEGIAALICDCLQIILMIIFMLWMNWRLTLINIATLSLVTLITQIFKTYVSRAISAIRHAMTNLNIFVQERILSMCMVQILGREIHELQRFKTLNNKYKESSIRAIKCYVAYFPVLSLLNAITISLLVWYGAHNIIHELSSIGQLIAFLMYTNLFFRPLHRIAERLNTLQNGVVSMRRVMCLLQQKKHIDNHKIVPYPKLIQGAIRFESVSFSYLHQQTVLKDISFEMKAGTSLAIVGATGAGKSTIIQLLTRFYDVKKGGIYIDDKNINDYPIEALRQQIGLVPQNIYLFSGSIYHNITLGNPHISMTRVVEATKQIGMHTFIQHLPGGYNYHINTKGTTLSTGQKQLLAFARILVYDPRILILDEATASLDEENESRLQTAMHTLMKGRTCLLIAHRLTTIQHANKILLLKHGEIQEEGTHIPLY